MPIAGHLDDLLGKVGQPKDRETSGATGRLVRRRARSGSAA
jgi:hypothetical protein